MSNSTNTQSGLPLGGTQSSIASVGVPAPLFAYLLSTEQPT